MSFSIPKKPTLPESFHEQYEIKNRIGVGASAEVFRATQRNLDREVVVKIVWGFSSFDEAMKKRLLQEVRLVSEIHHPNVIRLLDYGNTGKVLYLVHPFEPGVTVKAHLKRFKEKGKRADPTVVERVMVDTLKGLKALHSRGIIHRDLKPDNLLVVKGPAVRILDLGLAKDLDAGISLTGTGGFLGTPIYMSPQQSEGEPADPRDDLYSLGVVCYELATGTNPFRGSHIAETFYLHQMHQPPKLGGNSGFPPVLGSLIDACLGKRHEDRPKSAEEALERLQRPLKDLEDEELSLSSTLVDPPKLPPQKTPTEPKKKKNAFAKRAPRRPQQAGLETSQVATGLPPRHRPRPRGWLNRQSLKTLFTLSALSAIGLGFGIWVGRQTARRQPVVPPVDVVPVNKTTVRNPFPPDFIRDLKAELDKAEHWYLGEDGKIAKIFPDPFSHPPKFLSSDPFQAGEILSALKVAGMVFDWIDGGGEPEHLPISLLRELKDIDSRYRSLGAPRPFFPYIYCKPLTGPGLESEDGWINRAEQSLEDAMLRGEQVLRELSDPQGFLMQRVEQYPKLMNQGLRKAVKKDPLGAIGSIELTRAERRKLQSILEGSQESAQLFLYSAAKAVLNSEKPRELAQRFASKVELLEISFLGQLGAIPSQRILGTRLRSEAMQLLHDAVELRGTQSHQRYFLK